MASDKRLARGIGATAALLAALLGALALHQWGRDNADAVANRKRASNRSLQAVGQALPGTPDPTRLSDRLKTAGLSLGAPVFIRVFKREFELEVWLKRGARFHRLDTYPVCNWSGRLGPKVHEGDRQAPEGFYTVEPQALNPNSRWHRSFNLGFPNAFDRAHGRTGSFLMVHGGCSSVGCFAMTDPVIDEIWRIITTALAGGQKRFHVHVYPFRMTEEALAAASGDASVEFWRTLAPAHEAFEQTHQLPEISVCQHRYQVTAGGGPLTPAADLPINAVCPG